MSEDVTRAPRGLPDYGDVLGYVVLVDDMHDGKFFGVPTEDHAEALRALRHYSNNGLTCFMGEVRRVESQPEKPAGGLT